MYSGWGEEMMMMMMMMGMGRSELFLSFGSVV